MKSYKRLPVLFLAVAMPSLLLACGGDEGNGGNVDAGVDSGPSVCTPTESTTYVVNKVNVPLTSAEAEGIYGFDLNGDDTPDNKVGKTLATLKNAVNVDVPGSVDKAINEGSAILLIDLKASDLASASCASASVYLGANASPAPCLDDMDTVCGQHLAGTGQFDIAETSPTDATVLGRIINGTFEGGPDAVEGATSSTIVIELPVIAGAPPLRLSLLGAHIDIQQVSADGLMEGRLGGAVPVSDVEMSILPTLHQYIDAIITADCTGTAPDCCADPESTGATLLGIFDADKDCTVPLQEMKDNALISSLLNADLDLLDADGNYAPNTEGTKESLSLGLGFTATTGTFTAP